MTPPKLSPQAVLDAIKRYTAKHGYSPTVRELAKMTGTGVGTIHSYLSRLINGGYLKVEQPRRRVLRVMKDYDQII